jgi:hypothetical protein
VTWDTAATAAQREDERQRRRYWAEYDRLHPPPRKPANAGPGRWMVPAWTGPDSPQVSVWVPDPAGQLELFDTTRWGKS